MSRPDLALVGQMRYEVECRDLLHIAGGKEYSIIILFDVEDPDGNRHQVKLRMPEKDFGQFVADVGLDLFRLKAPKPPGSEGATP